MKLIATKAMTYATRRLVAGDAFEARSRSHGLALIAIRKAKRAEADVAPVPTPTPAPEPSEALVALREKYHEVLGKRPFHGWDEATLKQKIKDHDGQD